MQQNEKASEVRNLKYVYTQQELVELGKEYAYANRQLAELEDQKKSLNAQMTSQISAQKEMVNLLTGKVGNGYQYRDVECVIFFHKPEKGMKTVLRTDIDESRKSEMDIEIREKMTEKDWILWNDKYQSIECEVEMHAPIVDQKTYTQRTTGIKFIEAMTDNDREQFEDECTEVKINTPREGRMTLIHPSGVIIETKMNQAYMDRHLIQQELFPKESTGKNTDLDKEEIVIDDLEEESFDEEEEQEQEEFELETPNGLQ